MPVPGDDADPTPQDNDVSNRTGGTPTDQLRVTDASGERVLVLEPNDAIDVTFYNTLAHRRDTTQGVVERIRADTEQDEVVIELSTDVTVHLTEGGTVRFDDRRRGHLPRDVVAHTNIRHLFE